MAIFLFPPQSPAQAETKITITFAAGGVACGVYFFFSLTTGDFAALQYPLGYEKQYIDNRGLINYTVSQKSILGNQSYADSGWKMGFPILTPLDNNRLKDTIQMEIIKINF